MESFVCPLINALLNAEAYAHATARFHIQETHISWVLLTGDYAYKIKKPVKFAFLDFSTLEKRHFYCLEELRLNQRLAPDLYLGLVRITGTPQEPRMDGEGAAIEYAIKMRQFPSNRLLSNLAEAKQLGLDLLEPLVSKIAAFHGSITKADASSPFGTRESIKHWFDENISCIQPLLDDPGQLQQLRDIQIWAEQEWQLKSELIRQRKEKGFVRECHGDLHLGNITMIDGDPVPFDGIEFNPELRWIDVINEMAFLMLDLFRFACDGHAHWSINRYLQLTGDYAGLGVLRFYWVYRAMVRAKLALLRGLQQQGENTNPLTNHEYQSYLNLALRFIMPAAPSLIITHGFSGSGKSFLAHQLVVRIGAIQIRSDIERKRLFGYQEHENTGGSIYSPEAHQKTYQRLYALANAILAAGFTAIVDAAFLKSAERSPFRELAANCQVRFGIISVQAPASVLRERIRGRKLDASEATLEVLARQMETAEPLTAQELEATRVIRNDAGSLAQTLTEIEGWLR